GAPRDRVDQLADAMHDEGDLRPVPAAALRPVERHRDGSVLLLQPGPGPRPRRLPDPAPPSVAEWRAGEVDQAVDRPLPATSRLAHSRRRGVKSAPPIKRKPPGWGAFHVGSEPRRLLAALGAGAGVAGTLAGAVGTASGRRGTAA